MRVGTCLCRLVKVGHTCEESKDNTCKESEDNTCKKSKTWNSVKCLHILDGKETIQHLFTTDRTPSTLQDQESFKSDWQVIRKYSSL